MISETMTHFRPIILLPIMNNSGHFIDNSRIKVFSSCSLQITFSRFKGNGDTFKGGNYFKVGLAPIWKRIYSERQEVAPF